jgi:hypothetical protein
MVVNILEEVADPRLTILAAWYRRQSKWADKEAWRMLSERIYRLDLPYPE